MLQGKKGKLPSCTFPCLFHNNFNTQIIMEQTRKNAPASCACSYLQHSHYDRLKTDWIVSNNILAIQSGLRIGRKWGIIKCEIILFSAPV